MIHIFQIYIYNKITLIFKSVKAWVVKAVQNTQIDIKQLPSYRTGVAGAVILTLIFQEQKCSLNS